MTRRRLMTLVLLAGGLTIPSRVTAEDRRTTTVGMPARIEQLVLPGPELEVKPLEGRDTPIVLRILNTYRHGTAFRYDVEYYGLDAGTFYLTDFLRRKDGSPVGELPAVRVTIEPVLPPGQITPHALAIQPAPFLGGYRALLIVAGVVWLLGLAAILFVSRKKRGDTQVTTGRPLTLADRLRPLVEKAVAGGLTQVQLADLERTLLAYWRRRLGLEGHKPAQAIALLRSHPEAGPLIAQLEVWLHRPGAGGHVDIAALLRPYQNIAPDALESDVAAGHGLASQMEGRAP